MCAYVSGMDNMKSPCIRRCSLDSDKICQACYCSLEEIVSWHDATDTERQRIASRADSRRAARNELEDLSAAQPA